MFSLAAGIMVSQPGIYEIDYISTYHGTVKGRYNAIRSGCSTRSDFRSRDAGLEIGFLPWVMFDHHDD